MPVPPNSFTSFTPVPPPPPGSGSAPPASPDSESASTEPAVSQEPIPPASATAAPASAEPAPPITSAPRRRDAVLVGSILGLAAGLGVGLAHFDKQPHVYESTARIQVAGPGGTAASAESEAAVARSPRVLNRAARKLDEQKPFEVPPPDKAPDAAAFIAERLDVQPRVAESGLVLSFRGPSRFDTAKYLRAVIDAYRVEVEGRGPGAAPAVPVAQPSAPPPGPDSLAANDARIQDAKKRLAAVTEEPIASIETRLKKNRADLDAFQKREAELDQTIAAIEKAGSGAAGRVAAMKELGLEVNTRPVAQVQAAEKELKALQAKKADLGRRLGPEHRDMVALDEDIQQVKAEIAKANAGPKRPDALDRLHEKAEADRAALAVASASLRAAISRDEKTRESAAPLAAELANLTEARAAAAQQPGPKQPEPNVAAAPPAAPSAGAAVKVVEPPQDGERIAPKLYRSLIPGGLLGLLGGALLGLGVSKIGTAARSRVRRIRENAAIPKPKLPSLKRPTLASRAPANPSQLRMPVLGRIPAIPTSRPPEKKSTEGLNPILVAFHRPGSAEAEAFRQVRRELMTALDGKGHQVLAVTSPDRGDGKSTAAANLAIALAQSGKRVILVDCDLQTPAVQGLFRLTRLGDGLKSVMAAEVDLRMAVRSCEVGNLYLLPAGRGDVDPADLLTRPKFRELIADLRSSYEYVLLDAPPVTAEPELAALAAESNGTVLVVRSGSDAAARADRAKSRIIAAGSQVTGAIETAAPPPPRTDPAASTAPQETVVPIMASSEAEQST